MSTRKNGFLLRDIPYTKLMFTIPALTSIRIVRGLQERSMVDFSYQGSLFSAWVNNDDIALDTVDILTQ